MNKNNNTKIHFTTVCAFFLLFVFVLTSFTGCKKKNESQYVKVEDSTYDDLENVSIYSNDSVPDDSSVESAITEGGSTKKKPSATPTPSITATPTPTPSSSGSSSSGGGSSAPSGRVSGGGSGYINNTSNNSSSNSSNNSSSNNASSNETPKTNSSANIQGTGSIMESLRLPRTTIANKNGVLVIAASASANGIDLEVENNNHYPVIVYFANVRVNDTKVDLTQKISLGSNESGMTLLPLTDKILKQHNINSVTNISVGVSVKKNVKNTATPKPTNTPKPKKKKATATPKPNPTTPPVQINEDTQDTTQPVQPVVEGQDIPGDSGSNITITGNMYDKGSLIGTYGDVDIYENLVYNGYETRLIVTTVNRTGKDLKLNIETSGLFRGTTENTLYAYDGETQQSLIFDDKASSINTNITIYERYTLEEIGSTGSVTISRS